MGRFSTNSASASFFVFNTRLKIFHFILDETVPVADQFVGAARGDPIEIGKRTGFAFYSFGGRKILVGVNERQSRLNTYFDGPFDQLPENFIEGDALRDAILAVEPGVKGKIDRLGNFLRRLRPLSDQSLSAVSASPAISRCSAAASPRRRWRRPTAPPASSSPTKRRSARTRGPLGAEEALRTRSGADYDVSHGMDR